MDTTLTELIRISRAVGKDSSLVLGGFGNTSAKTADGKYMYIKASGTALKDMTERKGWRRLRVDSILAMLRDKSLNCMDVDEREAKVTNGLFSACDDKFKAGGKPSIESGFHSMLDTYVIHLHPAAVLAYVCAKNGQAELQKLFKKEKYPPLWVPYANPGYMLAKKIETLTRNYNSQYDSGPRVMFLQNHGLLVPSNNSSTALQLVRKVVNMCKSKVKRPSHSQSLHSSNRQTCDGEAFYQRRNCSIHSQKRCCKALLAAGYYAG
ncbi:MAG: class II aldolase/adducin family protein [Planctomycetota bacterium]|jgi:rhamnose utilization protein RhaD (predicted bifunctional aldolase and dehydrogenase)